MEKFVRIVPDIKTGGRKNNEKQLDQYSAGIGSDCGTDCLNHRPGRGAFFLLGNGTGAGIGFLVGTGTGIRAGGTGVGIG